MEDTLKEAQKHVGRTWGVPAHDGHGTELREIVGVRELDGRVVCLILQGGERPCQIVGVDMIEDEIALDARRTTQRRRWDEEQAAADKQRAEEESAQLAKFAGFLDDMAPIQVARARKALERECLWTDRMLSRLDRIRELVSDGARLRGDGASCVLVLCDRTWSAESLTKIGMDYAAHLIALRDGA